MASPRIISAELLLWSQAVLVWSAASYGTASDPLPEETARVDLKYRTALWATRALLVALPVYLMSGSITLSCFLLVLTLLQPISRYSLAMRWLAEFEALWILASIVVSFELIRHFHLASRWVPSSIAPAHLAALCVVASTLVIVIRGGTYIVRGVLRKSGTLPSKMRTSRVREESTSASELESQTRAPTVALAAAAEESAQSTVDLEEYNRGRLIGNLERIVLTLVVTAGSYAALAFLVAAKGVVRADEFEKSRDFTEYFLIGSLASVLVALCAGLVLRFALLRLWPELLALQM